MRTKGIRKGFYYVIVAVISIIAGYIFSSGGIFDSPRMFFLLTSWSMAIFFTQSIGNGYLIEKLDTRISWLTHPWRRLLIGFLVLVLFSFTAFQIVQLSFEYLVFGYKKEDFFASTEFWNRFFRTGRIAVIISIVISTIMTAIGFFRGWREAAVNEERLKNEVVTHQYATLRNQMNPHFLFNSLNVLSELVYENQDQAVRFIRKLSDVYRYVLDSRDKEVVPIDEEVEFVKTFAALLKERFSSNFEFEITEMEPPKGELFIVPMALQLLLENAVKHNVVSSAQPLKVSLIFLENAVRMENQIQLKRQVERSTSLGLTFLKNRYQVLSDQQVVVKDADGFFSVEVPFIRIQNTEK